jgi:hypothetical protein
MRGAVFTAALLREGEMCCTYVGGTLHNLATIAWLQRTLRLLYKAGFEFIQWCYEDSKSSGMFHRVDW